MSLSIGEALAIPYMSACKLIAGYSGIDNSITCIDSMEVPDILPWLYNGELLITTAYSIKDKSESLIAIISRMSEIRSAGIIIKTKFLVEIPQVVISLAEKVKIPIIIAPDSMPFVEMKKALMKALVEDSTKKLEFYKKINEELLSLQMNGGTIPDICRFLSVSLNSSVLLIDLQEKEKFKYPDNYQWSEEDNQTCYYQEVLLHGILQGKLFVSQKVHKLDELSLSTVKQASVFIAIELSRVITEENNIIFRDMNFFHTIRNRFVTEKEINDYISINSWLLPPYRMIALHLELKYRKQEDFEYLKSLLFHYFREKRKIRWIVKEGDFIAGIASADCKMEEITQIFQSLSSFSERLNIAIIAGVSTIKDTYQALSEAFDECINAIKILSQDKGTCHKIEFIDRKMLENEFLIMLKQPFTESFINKTLTPIQDFDNKYNGKLQKTLLSLIESRWILVDTAQKMGIHRNTLSNRIKKIEEITGFSFDNPNTILQFQLALNLQFYKKNANAK